MRRAVIERKLRETWGLLAHDTFFRDGPSECHAGAPMHVEGGLWPIAQPCPGQCSFGTHPGT